MPGKVIVELTWWGRVLVHGLALAMRLGLVEPTVARAEGMADWLLKVGAVRVEVRDG